MQIIEADWPAPAGVRALTTTVAGGVSQGPWASLNLGTHVGDDPDAVAENRRRLAAWAGLSPSAFGWLNQVHGTAVADLDRLPPGVIPDADAAVTGQPGRVAVVMTADCLPVLFCTADGRHVAAAHAGWRGLVSGVLEATLDALAGKGAVRSSVLAWLGPAIGPEAFEVGEEVRDAFLRAQPEAETAFSPSPAGRWLADLYKLARLRLQRAGVSHISGGGWCTWSDSRFFSHRRQAPCGRMATLIWRNQP